MAETDENVRRYNDKINQSIVLEKMGEAKSEAGDSRMATRFYMKAMLLEEQYFGLDTPTMAILQDKLDILPRVGDDKDDDVKHDESIKGKADSNVANSDNGEIASLETPAGDDEADDSIEEYGRGEDTKKGVKCDSGVIARSTSLSDQAKSVWSSLLSSATFWWSSLPKHNQYVLCVLVGFVLSTTVMACISSTPWSSWNGISHWNFQGPSTFKNFFSSWEVDTRTSNIASLLSKKQLRDSLGHLVNRVQYLETDQAVEECFQVAECRKLAEVDIQFWKRLRQKNDQVTNNS